MTQKHLGKRVHDLLDQRLSRVETVEAMEHLDECAVCAERWRELRASREALNSSEAGIDMRFAQQLLDTQRMAQIAREETPHRARAASGTNRRPATMAVASFAVVLVGVAAAYIAGAPPQVSLEFASGPQSNAAQSVAYHPADSLRAGEQLRSWVHPDWEQTGLVPLEAKVVRRANGANALVASVLAGMDRVIIIEHHGQLADTLMSEVNRANVEGVVAYVLSEDPAQIVWQTGDVVIYATCECSVYTLESVAEAFPVDAHPGFVDRVSDGVSGFVDALLGN